MRGLVDVQLWGTTVGTLGYGSKNDPFATFEYNPEFLSSNIQISPLFLQYPPTLFTFRNLDFDSFHGLPGFIADSLPDKFGNQLIDVFMADKNIPPSEVTALDRLNYVADRGIGALEYKPGESLPLQKTALDLQHLAELAQIFQGRRTQLQERLLSVEDRAAALSMIRIGSSAGGARSKALVARSPRGIFLDGTVNHGPDYTYWLLKFESSENQDKDSKDQRGMPVLEYIYSLVAQKAGIDIPRTDLVDDGKDRHFLIERFDRVVINSKIDKIHYASWAGIGHADRNGMYSYEQIILLTRQLNLGPKAEEEIFRRAVFNIIGRNQDDHTKNTGFLMDRKGNWRLSPAFDLTYSHDPFGSFTRNHQCWLNKKNNEFETKDLLSFGQFCNIREKKRQEIIDQVRGAFGDFSTLATTWELPIGLRKTVETNLRMDLGR